MARQERVCREYAKENGFRIRAVFKEKAKPTLQRRKALRYLGVFCFHEQVPHVISLSQKCVARNNSELFLILRFLESRNAELFFVQEINQPNF
jgi:hypothetical protein